MADNWSYLQIVFVQILKQELYETQLQLRTKIDFVNVLQNDVEQLHVVEDENIKLKSELTTKELDLKQWTIKVSHLNCNIYLQIKMVYILYFNIFQYSNLEFKLLEQQKDHLLQIDLLNEKIIILKETRNKPFSLNDLPTNLNETIITELKTELDDKKVF